MKKRIGRVLSLGFSLSAVVAGSAQGAHRPMNCVWYAPWNCPSTNPDVRANYFVAAMSTAQKQSIVDGKYAVSITPFLPKPAGSIGSAGYVPGVSSFGLPALQETDGALGVADPVDSGTKLPIRGTAGYSTALPSALAVAATFDTATAYASGAMVGNEARSQGFNVVLAGAMDLARESRGGRNFEYVGEDPWLAGNIAGQMIRGVQSNHVLSTVKHFVFNDQETGRMFMNAQIGSQAARESDLLAFEFAIGIGSPGAVMCSYNLINSVYACSNDGVLTQILKQDWHFPGYVMSDWGAMHEVTDANAGLDQESGDIADILNGGPFFSAKLTAALANGTVSTATLNEMTHRILRSEFATGLADYPPVIKPITVAADQQIARAAEQEAIVLLQNKGSLLPLSKAVRRIVVIGSNANNGVLSGGGSSQVWPVGGPAQPVDSNTSFPHPMIWDPSPPLAAIAAEVPSANVSFNNGASPSAAAAAAAGADVAIVFVNQWTAEQLDAATLSLPLDPITNVDQDQLVSAVAAANPNTIVVIESGGPVLMPWLGSVAAVLEAWYPGSGGGPAISGVLFGDNDAQGRLPITFPASTAQLPRPVINSGATANSQFTVDYDIEGANVGYRWFSAQGFTPQFPFGFGLSYTKFSYSGLQLSGGAGLKATFTVTNTGTRAGSTVPQLYLSSNPGAAQPPRLLGFARVKLAPGASQQVSMTVDNRLLARWSDASYGFVRPGGNFGVVVATSAESPVLSGSVGLSAVSQGP